MAMTACFATPVFNMLLGLGVGFLFLLKSDDHTGAAAPVELGLGIAVAFGFLAPNCACLLAFGALTRDHRVPREYGFGALAMYAAYLAASFALFFGGAS